MGRRRKTDLYLPQRVYRRRNAYYWFPPNEIAERLGKTAVKLGVTFPEAMAKYAEFVEPPVKVATMNDLFDRYMSQVAPTKSPRTYRDNLREVELLRVCFGVVRSRCAIPS